MAIVFNPRPTGDPQLDEIQRDLQLVVREIDKALRAGVLGAPVFVATTSHQITDETFVVYVGSGGTGQRIGLPSAQAAQGRTSRPVFIFNSGPGTVALGALAGQTVNAASSVNLTTGQRAVVFGDGATKLGAIIQ